MGWVKMSDDFAMHPKVRRLSRGALLALLESWCYAAKYRTDGVVELDALPSASPEAMSELVAKPRQGEPLWAENDDGTVTINGWLEHNLSRSQDDDRRQKERERKAKWRDKQRDKTPDETRDKTRGPLEPEPDLPKGRVHERPALEGQALQNGYRYATWRNWKVRRRSSGGTTEVEFMAGDWRPLLSVDSGADIAAIWGES